MSDEKMITTTAEIPGENSPKKAQIAHDYWLMTQKLEKDAFYNFLKELRNPDKKYTAVLAIDFGHGETTAYFLTIEEIVDESDENAKIKTVYDDDRLNITKNAAAIPTRIGFVGTTTFIGSEAEDNCNNFYQYFKRHPGKKRADGKNAGNWSDYAPNKASQTEKTYKELTEDYFRKVFRSVLDNLSDDNALKKAYKDGTLLVSVGCPASAEWLNADAQKDFKDLIRKAITDPEGKIATPLVTIVPESTAALMASMVNKNATTDKIDISRGIIIFDMGSSTIDVTFILPGGKIITKSLRKGGSHIDWLIFITALRISGLYQNDITDEEKPELLVRMREIKEAFYNNPAIHKKITALSRKNPFYLNKEFMNEVWGSQEGQALLEIFREFVKNCYNEVKGYGCANVLITGGTGKVTEFSDIVKEVFGTDAADKTNDEDNNDTKTHFISFEDTSYCVAQGLCLMKKIEFIGQEYLDEYCKKAEQIAEYKYSNIMREIAKKATPTLISVLKNVAGSLGENEKITSEELCNRLEKNLKANKDFIFNNEKILKEIMSEAIAGETNSFLTTMKTEASKIAEKIYGNSFVFSHNILEGNIFSQDKQKNSQNITSDNVLKDLLTTDFLGKTVFAAIAVLSAVAAFLLVGIPIPFGGFLDSDKLIDNVNKTVVKFKDFTGGFSKNDLSKTNADKSESKLIEDICMVLCEQEIFKDVITDFLSLNAEAVLGKVMFYVYDNEPQAL